MDMCQTRGSQWGLLREGRILSRSLEKQRLRGQDQSLIIVQLMRTSSRVRRGRGSRHQHEKH